MPAVKPTYDLKQLVTHPVGRLLWQYSLPAVVGMVVMSLYNIVDRVFIGQAMGAGAISGLTVTFPVMNLATAMGVLVGAGASARVSIHLGAGRMDMAQRILGNALTLTLVIGTAYMCIFAVFLDPILRAFGASEATLPYAHSYMVWILPGLLLTNLSFSFNNIQRASGYPRRAMWTMIISAVINIALTPLFIFGLGMGIEGAALATDIAMVAAMVFVFTHFFRQDSTLHFVKGTFRLHGRTVLAILGIGTAPALVNAAAACVNMLVNTALRTHGSDMAIGAAGIFITYTSMLVVVVLGICQGMQPIMGYNYGAGNLGRLRRTYNLSVAAATALCVAGCVVGYLWPDAIARCFTTDNELIRVTAHGLPLAMIAFSLAGFQIVSTNFFQSIGLVPQSIILSLSRQVVFMIPLLLTLPPLMGLTGIWICFPVSDIMASLLAAYMIIHRFRKINALHCIPRHSHS